MRVEILVKASIAPSPAFGFIGENVRQFLVRQSPHLKVVKVVLGPNLSGANQPFLAMFRVEFNTGGCLIVETKGDSPGLAFSAGLLKVGRGLDSEMRSRWLSMDTKPIPKAFKARGPRVGRRISYRYPKYLRIFRLSNAEKGEILTLPPPLKGCFFRHFHSNIPVCLLVFAFESPMILGDKSLRKRIKRSPLRRLKLYYLRQFPRHKTMKGGFLHRLLGDGLFDKRLWKPNRTSLAAGMAIGLFVGLLPTYWVQIAIAVMISFVLKVNITASVLGTAITNPFTTIPIVSLQYKIGLWLMGPADPHEIEHYHGWMKLFLSHGKPYLVGSTVTAILGSILGYLVVVLFWRAGTKIKSARENHPA